ncbi:MAG TPA: glycoside hydrolase family 88 protein, partial [Longimicrobiales bacterium]
WDYTGGLVLWAIEQVGQRAHDPALQAYVQRNVDRFVQPDGRIAVYDSAELSLDRIEPGNVILALWQRTHDPRYRTAAATLRRQLSRQPRTDEGGFWHKQIYPQQMWVDGIYMASPFYARYGQAFGESAAFEDVARQILLVARHLRDPRTGLYYHGWDAAHKQIWADSLTGLSPSLWARGDGWYLMGLVDVLDVLPTDHPDRPQLLRVLRDLAESLARVQDPASGLWYQVLDQPNRAGNYLEASGSAMFVYALAHAARRGHLGAEYLAVAQRGFAGIVKHLLRPNPDGTLSLTQICGVAGLGGRQQRDGSFHYYVHEPIVADDYKGVGPFMLAALELGR